MNNIFSLIILIIGTSINRIISIIKIRKINAILGNDATSDIMFTIDRFFMLFRNLFGYGNMESIITSYIKQDDSHDFIMSLIVYLFFSVTTSILVLIYFSTNISLAYSIPQHQTLYFYKCFALLAPTVISFALLSVLNASYTFHKKFKEFTFFPIISNIIFISCLYLYPSINGFIIGNNLYAALQFLFLLVVYYPVVSDRKIWDFKLIRLPLGLLQDMFLIVINFLLSIVISTVTNYFFSYTIAGTYSNVQYILKFIYTIITTIIYSQTRVYTKETKDPQEANQVTALLLNTVTVIFTPIVVFIFFYPVLHYMFPNIKNLEYFQYISKSLIPILCLASYNYIFSWLCVMKKKSYINTIGSAINVIFLLGTMFLVIKLKKFYYISCCYTIAYFMVTLLYTFTLRNNIPIRSILLILETAMIFGSMCYFNNIYCCVIACLIDIFTYFTKRDNIYIFAGLITTKMCFMYLYFFHVPNSLLYFLTYYSTYLYIYSKNMVFFNKKSL